MADMAAAVHRCWYQQKQSSQQTRASAARSTGAVGHLRARPRIRADVPRTLLDACCGTMADSSLHILLRAGGVPVVDLGQHARASMAPGRRAECRSRARAVWALP